jgi:hypothetical protein
MEFTHNRNKNYTLSFKWHNWFAWRPVSDGNTIYWLETIKRRRKSIWHELFWEYKK